MLFQTFWSAIVSKLVRKVGELLRSVKIPHLYPIPTRIEASLFHRGLYRFCNWHPRACQNAYLVRGKAMRSYDRQRTCCCRLFFDKINEYFLSSLNELLACRENINESITFLRSSSSRWGIRGKGGATHKKNIYPQLAPMRKGKSPILGRRILLLTCLFPNC